jgi:TolB protein
VRHRMILLTAVAIASTSVGSARAAVPATQLGTAHPAAVSANGRFLAFVSDDPSLVAGDTNNAGDVFVHDRVAGTTERVSVSTAGVEGDSTSGLDGLAMSADGRFIVFDSEATNLVAGDTDESIDTFIHDRTTGTTRMLRGALQRYSSIAISADGRYVVRSSPGSHDPHIARLDRATGRSVWVTIGSDENPAVIGLSADGNRVLAAGSGGIYVHDFGSGHTRLIRLSNLVRTQDGWPMPNALSADGRYVMFTSSSPDMVMGDTNGKPDVFVRDLVAHHTVRVSISNGERQAADGSRGLGLSGRGRYRLFVSKAPNLVAGDTNGVPDIFVRDSASGTTVRCSVATDGTQGNSGSTYGILSQNGLWIFFDSAASNLVPGDTDGVIDSFVRGPGC